MESAPPMKIKLFLIFNDLAVYFHMRRMTLKLAVAVTAFIIGIVGNAFWFFDNKETDNTEKLIRIIVKGQIIDNLGRPVASANVQPRLGLDLDGAVVETDRNSRFIAEANSPFWSKGCPSVVARAEGYAEEYVYFDCWDKGERQFEQTIVLKPNVVKLEEHQRLWQENRITDYNLIVSLSKSGAYRGAESVLVKIRNGQAISIEILDEKYKAMPLEEAICAYKQLDTVEKIFDHIQKALDEKADVYVRYNETFGYPIQSSSILFKKGLDQYESLTIWKFEIVTNE